MKSLITGLAVTALLVSASAAYAAEAKGKITAINGNARTFAVDGNNYYFPPATSMSGYTVGDTVTLTYETLNSRNVVSKAVK